MTAPRWANRAVPSRRLFAHAWIYQAAQVISCWPLLLALGSRKNKMARACNKRSKRRKHRARTHIRRRAHRCSSALLWRHPSFAFPVPSTAANALLAVPTTVHVDLVHDQLPQNILRIEKKNSRKSYKHNAGRDGQFGIVGPLKSYTHTQKKKEKNATAEELSLIHGKS